MLVIRFGSQVPSCMFQYAVTLRFGLSMKGHSGLNVTPLQMDIIQFRDLFLGMGLCESARAFIARACGVGKRRLLP